MREAFQPTDEAMRKAESILIRVNRSKARGAAATTRAGAAPVEGETAWDRMKTWTFVVGFILGLTTATFVWVWVCT